MRFHVIERKRDVEREVAREVEREVKSITSALILLLGACHTRLVS